MKTRYFLWVVSAVVLVTVTACSEKTNSQCNCKTTSFADSITLKYNQPVNINCCSEPFSIVLKNINDSRCPLTVQCVWSGTAFVTLQVSNYGEELKLELYKPKTISYSGRQYTYELTKLSPYPGGIPPDQAAYEAVIVIKRR